MNIEEVRKQLTDLEKEYETKVRLLKIKYARTLIKYAKGQTISDHYQTIKIDSISLAHSYGSNGFPEPNIHWTTFDKIHETSQKRKERNNLSIKHSKDTLKDI